MSDDTRPALTERWMELERRGATFLVILGLGDASLHVMYNGNRAITTYVPIPMDVVDEESMLRGIEFFVAGVA